MKKIFSNQSTLSQEEIDELRKENQKIELTKTMKIGLALIISIMLIILILVICGVI